MGLEKTGHFECSVRYVCYARSRDGRLEVVMSLCTERVRRRYVLRACTVPGDTVHYAITKSLICRHDGILEVHLVPCRITDQCGQRLTQHEYRIHAAGQVSKIECCMQRTGAPVSGKSKSNAAPNHVPLKCSRRWQPNLAQLPCQVGNFWKS